MLVMIVEDEPKITQILVEYLELEGFECETLSDGSKAVERIESAKPDFVILDLMLPGKDGLSICREVRQRSDVPILILTARGDELDRLRGLELGADDYVCKPFSPREVVSRVKTIMRRARGASAPNLPTHTHQGVAIYADRYVCTVHEIPVDLTPVEFRMLSTLIAAPTRVFSREQLMNASYDDYRVVSDRTIDSHIKNVRRKLSEHTDEPLIRSVYGVGYAFV